MITAVNKSRLLESVDGTRALLLSTPVTAAKDDTVTDVYQSVVATGDGWIEMGRGLEVVAGVEYGIVVGVVSIVAMLGVDVAKGVLSI